VEVLEVAGLKHLAEIGLQVAAVVQLVMQVTVVQPEMEIIHLDKLAMVVAVAVEMQTIVLQEEEAAPAFKVLVTTAAVMVEVVVLTMQLLVLDQQLLIPAEIYILLICIMPGGILSTPMVYGLVLENIPITKIIEWIGGFMLPVQEDIRLNMPLIMQWLSTLMVPLLEIPTILLDLIKLLKN
jgi:hypothetical protein